MNTMTETQVRLFASSKSWIEGEAVRQLYATAKLDAVQLAVGFPDLHPGNGTPVGAAFVTEGVIYPHLIGGDIGCGMALFKTDLVQRDAKLDRWLRFPSTLSTSGLTGSRKFSQKRNSNRLSSTKLWARSEAETTSPSSRPLRKS